MTRICVLVLVGRNLLKESFDVGFSYVRSILFAYRAWIRSEMEQACSFFFTHIPLSSFETMLFSYCDYICIFIIGNRVSCNSALF